MTKNLLSSLLVGVAFLATPAIAQAQECVWADAKIYGKYDVSKPIPAETVVSGLYKHKKYAPYHRFCTYDQFKAQFFAQNGGAVDAYDRGSVLLVPVPVNLDKAEQTPAPEPAKQADSTPAPAPTFSAEPRGGAMVDARIDRIEEKIANGGYNSAEIAAMKAEIEALRAAQAVSSSTQFTRVVEKPIYTTKTVQVGLSAAATQQLIDKAQQQIDRINGKKYLTDADRKLLDELENEKTSLLKSLERRMNSLTGDGTKKNPDGRVGRIEKRLDALDGWDPREWSLRDLLVAIGALLGTIAFFLGIWNLLRKAGKKEVGRKADRSELDYVGGNVAYGLSKAAGWQVTFDPADFEDQLRLMRDGEVIEVTLNSPPLNRRRLVRLQKLRGGLVVTTNLVENLPQMRIGEIRLRLVREFLDDGLQPEPIAAPAAPAAEDEQQP